MKTITTAAICTAVLLLGIAEQAYGDPDHGKVPAGFGKGPHFHVVLHPAATLPDDFKPKPAPLTEVEHPAALTVAVGHHDHPELHAHFGLPPPLHALMKLTHLPLVIHHNKLGRKLASAAQECGTCGACKDCANCATAPGTAAQYGGFCGGSDPDACAECQNNCPDIPGLHAAQYSGCAVCKGCCNLWYGACDACRWCSFCSLCP